MFLVAYIHVISINITIIILFNMLIVLYVARLMLYYNFKPLKSKQNN